MLKYLYQARHQSQHGRLSLEWSEPKILIAPGFNGWIKNLSLNSDGSFEYEATSADPSKPEMRLVADLGEPRLPTIVNNKHKQSYPPPTEHLGNRLVTASPFAIGETGLRFYEGVLNSAVAEFAHSSRKSMS